MNLPKQRLNTEIEPGIEVSTVEDYRNGYFDTCIFSDVELPGIDLQRSYRTMTWQGAREEHKNQIERVREALLYV